MIKLSLIVAAALGASARLVAQQPTPVVGALRADTTQPGVDSARAKDAGTPLIWLVSDAPLVRERLAELDGAARPARLLLRSMSSLLRDFQAADEPRVSLLAPQALIVFNSQLPQSANDGALWAGNGWNGRIAAGMRVSTSRFRLVLAPELVFSNNRFFYLRRPGFFAPPIPSTRSKYSFPWYVNGPYSVDMPLRFGNKSITEFGPGQSSIAVTVKALELGVASENEWWGPGIQNALILSNNAPGFPHLFIRASRPFQTRFGELDFRWIVGGLTESKFFDTVSANDVRSISAAAFTVRPRGARNLTLGGARSVWAAASGWGDVSSRWFDVFRGTGRPNNRALSDSGLYPGGRDQLYSLFARWLFPDAGFELYGEWGRSEFPVSLGDFMESPNHTQAYTLGFQWRRAGFGSEDFWRLHAENTSVEQSATFRDRPTGVWYTSRKVIQGYTNRGQPLGAAVGPGSSGQTVAIDYFRPTWSAGVNAGRARLNEDVRGISKFPDYQSWCTHDVYLYWGFRGSKQTALGHVAADLKLGNRLNTWFQVQSGCPRGEAMVDDRNNTLSITIAPGSWWR